MTACRSSPPISTRSWPNRANSPIRRAIERSSTTSNGKGSATTTNLQGQKGSLEGVAPSPFNDACGSVSLTPLAPSLRSRGSLRLARRPSGGHSYIERPGSWTRGLPVDAAHMPTHTLVPKYLSIEHRLFAPNVLVTLALLEVRALAQHISGRKENCNSSPRANRFKRRPR